MTRVVDTTRFSAQRLDYCMHFWHGAASADDMRKLSDLLGRDLCFRLAEGNASP